MLCFYRALALFIILSTVNLCWGQIKKTSAVLPVLKRGPLKVADYDYYVLIPIQSEAPGGTLSNEFYNPYFRIMDVRTGVIVAKAWPEGDTYLSKGRMRLLNTTGKWPTYTSHIVSFDTSGLVQSTTPTVVSIASKRYQATFDPNFLTALIQKENDFWIADVDVINGKIGVPRQLTRFGFLSEQPIWAWFKDGVALGRQYWINTRTGDVEDINIPDPLSNIWVTYRPQTISQNPHHHFSIDHQFVIHSNAVSDENWGGDIVDIATNKLITVNPGAQRGPASFGYWMKNRQLMLYDRFARTGTMYMFSGDGQYKSSPLPVSTYPGEDPRSVKATGLSNVLLAPTGKAGRLAFSPDTTKYLIQRIDDNAWYIYEPLTGKVNRVGEAIRFISWADNDHLIYCKTGATAIQGTYILDLKTNNSKKLFNYIIDNVFGLTENSVLYHSKTNYILFCANHILWRCHPDGSELTELLKEPTTNFTIMPFLTGTVD